MPSPKKAKVKEKKEFIRDLLVMGKPKLYNKHQPQ